MDAGRYECLQDVLLNILILVDDDDGNSFLLPMLNASIILDTKARRKTSAFARSILSQGSPAADPRGPVIQFIIPGFGQETA
jgi:hypothetical protein